MVQNITQGQEDIARRRDDALRRALSTPPQPKPTAASARNAKSNATTPVVDESKTDDKADTVGACLSG